MKNSTIDLFMHLSQNSRVQDWDKLTRELTQRQFRVKIGDFNELLISFLNKNLSQSEKQYLYESFKVNKNPEENPDDINECIVSVRDLVSTRLQRKNKRIDDLIAI